MPEEEQADQCDNAKFFQQFVAQVVNSAIDQLRAVIGRDQLHARRQARLEGFELILHRLQSFARIFAGAQDNYTSDNFPLTVQLSDAAAHFRT